jgi:hypothetical protein
MPVVGYARVSSYGQDLSVQLEKLETAECEKIFKEKRSGVDTGTSATETPSWSPRSIGWPLDLRPLPHHLRADRKGSLVPRGR